MPTDAPRRMVLIKAGTVTQYRTPRNNGEQQENKKSDLLHDDGNSLQSIDVAVLDGV
jgi:hypothetical protein